MSHTPGQFDPGQFDPGQFDPGQFDPGQFDPGQFDMVDLVRSKRDGGALGREQIVWLMQAYVAGHVPDEQVAALLMAVVWRGMLPGELSSWTDAMVSSGERIDLSGLGRPTVDKHSTGGVGDKVSLVLAPLVAACGAAVPQLSGRGLGHTGGTLDKLESIPGFRTDLQVGAMMEQLEQVGCVICAAGPGLAPADRKLYALRDVTATIESVPLIAASIMSKKIAEGTGALVLDVKVGSGAFMATAAEAAELARTMVSLGRDHGVDSVALLTSMESPLGNSAGNALEVAEAVEVLAGGGPHDLIEVTVALATEMLSLVGLDVDPRAALADGSALDVWRHMVAAQGGDPDAPLPKAKHVTEIRADRSGVLSRLDAHAIGVASWRLGAGRARKEDPVSATAGVLWHARPGEHVRAGDVLFELHTDDETRVARASEALQGAVEIGGDELVPPPLPPPLVIERIA